MISSAVAALLAGAVIQPVGVGELTRPVAGIVSPIWSDAAHRDAAREVEQIVERLQLKPGISVADIGAGNGYDSVRLAQVVGPRGRVFAEDVTPAYLQQLRKAVSAAKLTNVEVVQGAPGDPRLAPRSIDAAVMVHMYHEIEQPMALLTRLASAFRAGGRLGIEELDRPTRAHGTPPKLLTCELAAAGYTLVDLKPLTGDIGYFAVFIAPAAPTADAAATARTCRG